MRVKPKGYDALIPVPCGKCPPCKRRRVNDWVFRLQEEDRRSSSSYFLTFTYEDKFLPRSPNGFPTLVKADWINFMKSLRIYYDRLGIKHSMKYYTAGEYGTEFGRPHFHSIFFNLPNVGDLEAIWKKGNIHVDAVSGASIAYTCKYIDKPKRIPMFLSDDRVPEFSLMSKRLGISYAEDPLNVAFHRADHTGRMWVYKKDGTKIALPRYLREKIFTKEQMRDQRAYIQELMDEKLDSDRERYYKLYSEADEDGFFRYLEEQKYVRLRRYYKDKKLRNNDQLTQEGSSPDPTDSDSK